MKDIVSIILLYTFSLAMYADELSATSDSIVVNELRKEGITFSHDNDVKLLMTGQEKFDDMF